MTGPMLIIQLITFGIATSVTINVATRFDIGLNRKDFRLASKSVKDFHLLQTSGACTEMSGSALPSNFPTKKPNLKWQ